MKTFREIALAEAKNPKTSISGKYYIQEVQDMVNWVEKQKEWINTMYEPGEEFFEFIFTTPKAALNKTKSIRKNFDDIISEHGNNGNVLEVILNTKEILARKKQYEKIEKNADYELYYNSYSLAIQAAEAYANKKGYTLDAEEMADKIGMGPAKPKGGKTNKFTLTLYKGSKEQKEAFHIQVYNRETSSKEYELNCYIS